MRYGMEVWAPRSAVERAAFAALDRVLLRAACRFVLHGLGAGDDTWMHARRLKSEVLSHDFGIPNMSSESIISRVRFRYRIDPALRRTTRQATTATGTPAPMPHTDWPLPAGHPWLAATNALMQELGLPGAPDLQAPSGFVPPTNSDITAAAQRCAAVRAYASHGAAPCRTGRKHLREAPAANAPAMLDGFKFVFARSLSGPHNQLRLAPYLRQRVFISLPIAMLRSGHLIPLEGTSAPPAPADSAYYCPHCGEHLSRDGKEPPARELPWLRICHVLLRCHSDSQFPRIEALLAFCEDFERLACSTGAYQLHVRRLTGALRTYRTSQAPLPPATALRVKQEFLHFMLAPLEWRDPPRHYSDWLFDMTARLLRGVLPRGESDSEEEHDSHLYDGGIKIAQLGSCEWKASTVLLRRRHCKVVRRRRGLQYGLCRRTVARCKLPARVCRLERGLSQTTRVVMMR
jgi:hypothetical protein